MPYLGGRLTDLVRGVREVTPPAARAMAAIGGRHLTLRTRDGTPIGPGTDYGHVRGSWTEKEVEHQRSGGIDRYRSGVESHHYRAPWVEWGVEPHDIEPDDAQAIDTPEGPRAGAHHPGYPGAHPVAKAVAELEATLPEVMQPELEAWAKAAEANAKRYPAIH